MLAGGRGGGKGDARGRGEEAGQRSLQPLKLRKTLWWVLNIHVFFYFHGHLRLQVLIPASLSGRKVQTNQEIRWWSRTVPLKLSIVIEMGGIIFVSGVLSRSEEETLALRQRWRSSILHGRNACFLLSLRSECYLVKACGEPDTTLVSCRKPALHFKQETWIEK